MRSVRLPAIADTKELPFRRIALGSIEAMVMGSKAATTLAVVHGLTMGVGTIGSVVQGVPLAMISAQQDTYMMLGGLAIGFAMILMIAVVAIVGLRSKNESWSTPAEVEALISYQVKNSKKKRRG